MKIDPNAPATMMPIRLKLAESALTGLLANSESGQICGPDGKTPAKTLAEVQEIFSAFALGYADALIAAYNATEE